MNFYNRSNREECTYKIKVDAPKPVKIRVIVTDPKKPHCIYTDRYKTINGSGTFEVRMPQSPEICRISVFNEKNGNKKQDKSFRVSKLEKASLKKTLTCYDAKRSVRSFVKFAQEFSENAGILSAGQPGRSIYESNDGKFRIIYSDYIIDNNKVVPDRKTGQFVPNPNFGRRLATPARISQTKGVIEIAKSSFVKYTIPMRMAILLHEFSHFYLNNKPQDEIEADLNALLIYLGLGYPRIEGHQAFLEVFKGTPTQLNKDRYDKIVHFINNFDKFGFKRCV